MLKSLVLAIICVSISPIPAFSEYVGEFEGEVDGEFIQQPGGDRQIFRLSKDLKFIDPNKLEWTASEGEVTDGTSVPSLLWTLTGGPFGQLHTPAAIVHDYYCCAKSRNFDDTHVAFHRGLLANGVSQKTARFMLWGVTIAGPDRWDVDPAEAELRPCRELSKNGRVIRNRYDYSALEIQRAIVSKHAAMVRTVNSTDGLVMDVVQGELIMVDSPRAFDHLQMISAAVELKFDFPIEKLGLFTSVAEDEVKGFETLVGWAPGQIPEIDQYLAKVGLTHTNLARQPRLIFNPLTEDLSEMPASLFSQQKE